MSEWTTGEVITAQKLNQKTVYIGDSAPASPQIGQLWLDTANWLLKFWDGSRWRICAVTEPGYLMLNLEHIPVAASDTVRHSNDTERRTTSETYVKLKEVRLNRPLHGTIRIKFRLTADIVTGENPGKAYAKIYKDGSPWGSEHEVSTKYVSGIGAYVPDYIDVSEDFTVTGLPAGTLIQIYGKKYNDAECAVSNMKICYDVNWLPHSDFTNQDPA
ncbi:hypothetical protein J7L13_00895 [bacterium]|nr:hypothetical protein [bacterium]